MAAVACLAACGGGGGGTSAKATTTASPPLTRQRSDPNDPSKPAFCRISPELQQGFRTDASDPVALKATLDAFIAWLNQTMEGAPEPVRKDLSYLVTRYEQVKAALVAGESPASAIAHFNEQRPELEAALQAFNNYRNQNC